MAVVRRITEGVSTTRIHPSETDALVHVVQPPGGGALIQISTFGSDERASEPKVSQTLQLDASAAKTLRSFIDKVFGTG